MYETNVIFFLVCFCFLVIFTGRTGNYFHNTDTTDIIFQPSKYLTGVGVCAVYSELDCIILQKHVSGFYAISLWYFFFFKTDIDASTSLTLKEKKEKGYGSTPGLGLRWHVNTLDKKKKKATACSDSLDSSEPHTYKSKRSSKAWEYFKVHRADLVTSSLCQLTFHSSTTTINKLLRRRHPGCVKFLIVLSG